MIFYDEEFLLELISSPANNKHSMIDIAVRTKQFVFVAYYIIVNCSIAIKFENW